MSALPAVRKTILAALVFTMIGMVAPPAGAISVAEIPDKIAECKKKNADNNAIAGWHGGEQGKPVATYAYTMSEERMKANHFKVDHKIDPGTCIRTGKWHNYYYDQKNEDNWWRNSLTGTNEYFYEELDSGGKPTGKWLRGAEMQWFDSWPNK